jgi:Flp pilus assembly protein TadG
MSRGFGFPRLITRLLRDEGGSYLLYMTVAIPVFIGFSALATEGALLFYSHRNVQSAADAVAYSAAVAYSINNSADITTQAQATVANYGFVVGTGNNQANVVATVDTTTYSPLTAIDVAVTRPQLPIISSIWYSNPFNVGGRAKAIISGGAGGGNGNCILSIAPTGSGITLQGTPTINTPGCCVFSNANGSCSGGGGATPSIALGGNASITAGSVGAAGCVSAMARMCPSGEPIKHDTSRNRPGTADLSSVFSQ